MSGRPPLPRQLIFTGGTGRSGTTIVGKVLGRHPQVRASKPIEIKFLSANSGLLDLTFGRREFVEMKKRRSLIYRCLSQSSWFTRWSAERRFLHRITDDWWDRRTVAGKNPGLSSGIDTHVRNRAVDEFFEHRKTDPRSAAIDFFYTMITEQNNNQGEPIWVDTSPPNIFNADRIHALLPHAKFIQMTRDGRNTIASVLKEHWGPNDPIKAIHWWKNRIIQSHKALSKVPEGQVIQIQLEDFAYYDREGQYQRLLEFLAIEDSAEMRAFFDTEVEGRRVIESRWRAEIVDPGFERVFRKAYSELQEMGIQTSLYD